MVRRSLCGPIACWILAQTSVLVTWSLYEMHSILRQQLISMACILWSSAFCVHHYVWHMVRVQSEILSPICWKPGGGGCDDNCAIIKDTYGMVMTCEPARPSGKVLCW